MRRKSRRSAEPYSHKAACANVNTRSAFFLSLKMPNFLVLTHTRKVKEFVCVLLFERLPFVLTPMEKELSSLRSTNDRRSSVAQRPVCVSERLKTFAGLRIKILKYEFWNAKMLKCKCQNIVNFNGNLTAWFVLNFDWESERGFSKILCLASAWCSPVAICES